MNATRQYLFRLNRILIENYGSRGMSSEKTNIPGFIESAIKSKLKTALSTTHLDVKNESYMHNVPKGAETHFKVVVVSPKFEGQPLMKRHRMINDVLKEELKTKIHALSIVAKTPEQWEASNKIVEPSPACKGGFDKVIDMTPQDTNDIILEQTSSSKQVDSIKPAYKEEITQEQRKASDNIVEPRIAYKVDDLNELEQTTELKASNGIVKQSRTNCKNDQEVTPQHWKASDGITKELLEGSDTIVEPSHASKYEFHRVKERTPQQWKANHEIKESTPSSIAGLQKLEEITSLQWKASDEITPNQSKASDEIVECSPVSQYELQKQEEITPKQTGNEFVETNHEYCKGQSHRVEEITPEQWRTYYAIMKPNVAGTTGLHNLDQITYQQWKACYEISQEQLKASHENVELSPPASHEFRKQEEIIPEQFSDNVVETNQKVERQKMEEITLEQQKATHESEELNPGIIDDFNNEAEITLHQSNNIVEASPTSVDDLEKVKAISPELTKDSDEIVEPSPACECGFELAKAITPEQQKVIDEIVELSPACECGFDLAKAITPEQQKVSDEIVELSPACECGFDQLQAIAPQQSCDEIVELSPACEWGLDKLDVIPEKGKDRNEVLDLSSTCECGLDKLGAKTPEQSQDIVEQNPACLSGADKIESITPGESNVIADSSPTPVDDFDKIEKNIPEQSHNIVEPNRESIDGSDKIEVITPDQGKEVLEVSPTCKGDFQKIEKITPEQPASNKIVKPSPTSKSGVDTGMDPPSA